MDHHIQPPVIPRTQVMLRVKIGQAAEDCGKQYQ